MHWLETAHELINIRKSTGCTFASGKVTSLNQDCTEACGKSRRCHHGGAAARAEGSPASPSLLGAVRRRLAAEAEAEAGAARAAGAGRARGRSQVRFRGYRRGAAAAGPSGSGSGAGRGGQRAAGTGPAEGRIVAGPTSTGGVPGAASAPRGDRSVSGSGRSCARV